MCLKPKCARRRSRIDPGVSPPCGFIAAAVELAMMSSTQRDRKLIAHLASECGVLREAKVMSIRGLPAANQTGSLGYRFDMMTVPYTARLR